MLHRLQVCPHLHTQQSVAPSLEPFPLMSESRSDLWYIWALQAAYARWHDGLRITSGGVGGPPEVFKPLPLKVGEQGPSYAAAGALGPSYLR
jgi:hypothetical protein